MTHSSGADPADRGLFVLVAEDDVLIAMDIEQTLVSGFAARVKVAYTLEEAFASLDAERPHLAIVNSDLDGVRVLPLAQRLVALGAPIVVVSGMPSRALAELADGLVLRKPHGPDELAAMVLRALARIARAPGG